MRVLVADDQEDVLKAIRLLLKGEGFTVSTVTSPGAALEAARRESFDVVLIDLNYTRDTTSGREGLDLIGQLQKHAPDLPIVVMTAWATIDLAVEAMRQGARDFIQKPWDNHRLVSICRTQGALSQALQRGRRLEDENRLLRAEAGESFLAKSAVMRPVVDMIEKVAPSDANILVTGENGTGKGVVARVLHARSLRRDEPFISVNMGGLPAGIFESELFGHVKGAFTDAKADRAGRFELADGGTIFLDEIANVPLEQQHKLLRLLETGEFERVGSSRTLKVNVRIVSATNADPAKEVATGRFRQDLLYRLNTIHVHLPPLRERLEDIDVMAEHFLTKHRQHYRKDIEGFSPTAVDRLRKYGWPGNVRELDHTVERAVLLASGRVIQPGDLALNEAGAGSTPASLDDMSLEDVEKYLIRRTMTRHGGSATKAADALGLSRSAFYRRLQRFGL